MSPHYPNKYERNKDCQITIRVPFNQMVEIRFEAFEVLSSHLCKVDYLAVHDGDSTSSPMIGSKLCGKSPTGTTLKSTGNVMTLHFHTNRYSTLASRSGFNIYADVGKNNDIILKHFVA